MIDIFQNIVEKIEDGQPCVFAMITEKEGSTPRGPGAGMLVDESGILCGTVGGGLAEYQAMEYARVMISGQEKVAVKKFSLNGDEKKGTDAKMICGGSIEIQLIHIKPEDDDWHTVSKKVLDSLINHQRDYLIIEQSGAASWCAQADMDKETALMIPHGGIKMEKRFFLPLPVKDRVVIFGGGHVAQALVPVLAGVGFRCVVFESREIFADKNNYPLADEIILGNYENIEESLRLSEQDYYVVMTHGHAYDREIEKQLLVRDFTYVGVMGSRRKKAKINQMLCEAGIPEDAIEKVHTPIGLDIGAQMPEEIAISIAAELIQVRAEARA